MELDDLKNTWKETRNPLTDQQTVNRETLEKISNQNFRSRVNKITIPEIVGSIVCLAAAVYIGSSFDKLDTAFLQGAGVLSILLLLLLPVISYLSTRRLKVSGRIDQPYAAVVKDFAVQKIRFIKLQKLNVTLSYLLLVAFIVLLSKLFSGKDISVIKNYWLFSFSIGFIFLLFYSKWVNKYYRKTLRQAEELLRELAA